MAAANGLVQEWSWGEARVDWQITFSSAALLFLNLLDGLFTLFFLQLGVAEEANPLMRVAYEHSPVAFMMLKLLVVHAGVMLLRMGGQATAARVALRAGALLYAGIVVYHLAFLARLIAE
jgi:hypothetical protein